MTYSLTRKEAIFRGMNVYKTGVPCTHGHIETRYVRSNNCTKCQKAATKKSWQKLKNEIERITKLEAIAGENRLDWQFESLKPSPNKIILTGSLSATASASPVRLPSHPSQRRRDPINQDDR